MSDDDDAPLDYTAAELSSDEDAGGIRYDSDESMAEEEDDAMSDVAKPKRQRVGPPRAVRNGNVVKFVQAGRIVWRAPVTIRAPAAAMASPFIGGGATPATAAAASAKRKATSPLPRETSSTAAVAAFTSAASSSRKRKDDSDAAGAPTLKLKLPRTAIGAALVHPSPVPPMGTFVNVSDGLQAMLPEVAQYPYTGPLLRKVAPGGAASASAPVDPAQKGPQPIIVPAFAAWFSLDQIHEIERACLPECFQESTQPASSKSRHSAYKEMRNFIIQTFRQNPRVYLSLTAVRKLLTGDATTLQRVHSFLESWGLINFHVDPGSLPSMASPGNFQSSYPLLQHSAITGFAPIIHTRQSPDVLQHLIHHHAHPGGNQSLRRSILLGASSHLTGEPLQTEYSLRRDPNIQLQCRACKSTSVENVRYVARQKRDYLLCADCFFSGKYPHVLSSSDFERYLQDDDANATDAERAGEWSREEVFRLLQGISMHSDDWESVSDHVRTRTKDECCLKFVQLPIEEPFLDQHYTSLAPNQTGLPSASALPDPATPASTALAHVPFADAPNPILSQVSFLAAYVSPSVAAAGAQAAMTFVAIQDMHGQVVKTPLGMGTIVIGGQTATQQRQQTGAGGVGKQKRDASSSSTPAAAGGAASASSSSAYPLVDSLPFESSSFTRPDGILTIDLPWARLFAHASQVQVATPQEVQAAQAATTQQQTQTQGGAPAAAALPPALASSLSRKDRPKEKDAVWTRDLVSLSHHVLQSAARKAVELAEEEERKVLRFVAQLTGALMKRAEAKLAHLDELDIWMTSHRTLYEASANSYSEERIKQQAAAAAHAAALAAEEAPKLGMLPPTSHSDPFRQF